MGRRSFNILQRSLISSTSRSNISYFVAFSAVQIKHSHLKQGKLSNVFIINIIINLSTVPILREISVSWMWLLSCYFFTLVSPNMLQDILKKHTHQKTVQIASVFYFFNLSLFCMSWGSLSTVDHALKMPSFLTSWTSHGSPASLRSASWRNVKNDSYSSLDWFLPLRYRKLSWFLCLSSFHVLALMLP